MFKLQIEGLENIRENQNYVVCANHVHFSDPIIIGAILPIRIRFMAKKELFKNKVFSSFLDGLGVFPVDRSSNDLKAVKHSLNVLKNGENLALFPEGTRNKGIESLPVKSGVAMLSLKTKTPILPITVDAVHKWFGPVRVKIHPEVNLETFYNQKLETAKLEEISQEIMDNIYKAIKYYKPLVDKHS